MTRFSRRGISIVEVIVAIVVIAVVIELGVLLLTRSRESARSNGCEKNLQAIGRALLLHHEKNGHYPTAGWGSMWLGDPDRGRGKDQPGSWEFCILPYIEGSDVPMIPKGLSGQAKSDALVTLCSTPAPMFSCSARRQPAALPVKEKLATNDFLKLPIRLSAKSDYAINTGDHGGGGPGASQSKQIPKNWDEVKDPSFQWYDTSKFTGISFGRSEVKSSELKNGTSKVYMLGEKTVEPDGYLTGTDKGDKASMYCGFGSDNGRSASGAPSVDDKIVHNTVFGSAHPDSWLAVFCDGSVHHMSYKINRSLHRQLANRLKEAGIKGKIDLD
jgi:type II secretory pathway pseudopilin PulG